MTCCPAPHVLRQLLDGSLTELPMRALYDHVEECDSCQSLLEEFSDEGMVFSCSPCFEVATARTVEPGLARVLERAGGSTIEAFDPADTVDALPPLGPPRREGDLGTLGSYDVEGVLGRGGMGIVLCGYDPDLQRRVALKVLRPLLVETSARARFVLEAQASARMRDDHIVGVHAVVNPADGPPFIVMEYLAGPTLGELIRRRKSLPPREAARICLQVANGVAAAHAVGLIHRDIKPGNVMIEMPGGRAKITDFGLVRVIEQPSGVTHEEVFLGTPAYVSPEQARGGAGLDTRADVYSLGATLYEALTGEPPFEGTAPMVLHQVLHDDPRPPRRLDEKVPRELETICLKAMAKEPSRRYQSAQAFAEDLDRWLHARPIRARPLGALGKARLWCRRQPVPAALLGALSVALAGMGWQWLRAQSSAAAANAQRALAEENGREAWASFEDARRAVDTFYTRFYTDGLLRQPGLESLRSQTLQDLLVYYRGFLKRRRHDPTLRADLAEACFRVALLTSDLGSKADAVSAFHEAALLFDELMRLAPNDDHLEVRLAQCHEQTGLIQSTLGQKAEALLSYQRALEVLERLAKLQPSDRVRRGNLVAIRGNIANLFRDTNQLELAGRTYEEILAILEQLIREEPAEPRYQQQLGATLNNLGLLYGDSHLRALAYHERAAKVRERLVQTNPQHHYWRRDLGVSYRHISAAERALGRDLDARGSLEKAQSNLRSCVAAEPFSTLYQYDLAFILQGLAEWHRDAAEPTEAIRLFSEARGLYERLRQKNPDDATVQVNLATVLGELGDSLLNEGRSHEAILAMEESRQIVEVRLRRDSADAERVCELIESLAHLTRAHHRLGQIAEARRCLLQAHELLGKLTSGHPRTEKSRAQLAALDSELVRSTTDSFSSARKIDR